MISELQIQNVVKKIANIYKPHKILLFGSYSKNTYDETSDLDILIIKDTDLPRHKRSIQIWNELKKEKIKFPIDILVYTNQEIENELHTKYSFIYEVFKTGKIVYEQ
ncbi:MAG: nucleotidyltransferase domain-containing protein [Alphaproteobacteria bacterium]|nr:nucleotidyltransferase domain-containing protein [Alphaproteobacteria bacterium]